MKKFLSYCATIVATAAVFTAIMYPKVEKYEEYIKTSEELLWMLEETCESFDCPWGDTVCETDVWCDYCDAREALGLDYLEHYSKVK